MMKKWIFVITGILLTIVCDNINTVFACTDFRLIAQDGSVLITRSQEFGTDLKSNLISRPRGKTFTNTTPNGKAGITWKVKYGYLLLDGFDTGIALDGMNEQGLSLEALYLPGETQYQNIPTGRENHALSYINFGDWVLGNFKSVEEVKQGLINIYVFTQTLPQLKNFVFPLHFAIHDNTGKSIVVEFTAGNMKVYDNDIGVLTNSPTYNWHINNLRNYLNLSPSNPNPVIENGMTFVAIGQGAGMVGLPGDISPPSRFVKIAIMLKTILSPNNADEALNIAQHIINNVDIPLGFVREGQNNNAATSELTQWVVLKDLTHHLFYYRTYSDLALHVVDLAKVDFSAGAPSLKMPIAAKQFVLDMTQAFLTNAVMSGSPMQDGNR